MTLECRRLTCFLFRSPIFLFAYLKRSKARRRQLQARKKEAKSKIHQLHQSCLQYEERGEEGIPLLKTSRKEAEEFLRLPDGVTKFFKAFIHTSNHFRQPWFFLKLFWNRKCDWQLRSCALGILPWIAQWFSVEHISSTVNVSEIEKNYTNAWVYF